MPYQILLSGGTIPFETLLLLIATVDVVGGFVLIFNSVAFLHNLLFYFGWIILVKGTWTLFDSLRKHFYFDYLGLIDVVCGGIMLLIFFGWSMSFLWFLGILLLLKGLWSMLNSM